MCKFCEDNKTIDTTIDSNEMKIFLDTENKRILNIRIGSSSCGVTKPILINTCPFCGQDLQELNCLDCYNYTIGDGIDDISECKGCIYKE